MAASGWIGITHYT